MASDLRQDRVDESTGELTPVVETRARRVSVEFGAVTHPGKVRTNNEDHYLIARMAKALRVVATSLPQDDMTQFSDEEGYLMVVADGMGGAAAGEQASALAVRTVEAFILDVVKWFLHLGRYEERTLARELAAAFDRADRNVMEQSRAEPGLAGMGTTLTMAYSVGIDLFIVHAGDTRAYLFRGGELRQLTTDHTLVQLLVQGGSITPEDAKHHHRRNVVTNVIGGPREGVQAEIHKVVLADGDVILLCSDGLTEPVDDEHVAAVLARHPDPDDACRQLLDQALQRGGPDNATIIVARYRIEQSAGRG